MATWTIDGPRRMDLDDITRLHVHVVGGAVNVVGIDRASRLEVTRVDGRPSTVRHDTGLLNIGYDWAAFQRGRCLAWLRSWQRPKCAEVTVAVPRGCAVEVRTIAAPVVVSGVRAPVTVRTISAKVALADLSQHVHAETVSGRVEAQGLTGEVWVHTVSGALTLAVGSGTVHAETISGSVTLDHIDAGAGDDLRVTTVSGAVRMRLPWDADVVARLHSVGGDVTSAFPELRDEGTRLVHGVLGSGSGRVWVKTTSGDIALLRRDPAGSAAPDGDRTSHKGPAPDAPPAQAEPTGPAGGGPRDVGSG